MKARLTRHLTNLLLVLISINCLVAKTKQNSSAIKNYTAADEIKFLYPDSALRLFNESMAMSIKEADTLQVITTLIAISDVHAHNGNFSQSYDSFWEALLLADESNNVRMTAKIYHGLGWLYSLYNRQIEMSQYFSKSISIHKQQLKESNNAQPLIDNYYALLVYHRKQNNIKQAYIYLDSCNMLAEQYNLIRGNMHYLDAEIGYLQFKEGKHEKALNTLLPLVEVFEKIRPSYQVILYFFIGEIYQELKENSKSEAFYRDAIRFNEKHKSHSDLLPTIYQRLSELQYNTGLYKKAYESLTIGTNLNELRFGSRSSINSEFLEIKDKFRTYNEEKEKERKEQEYIRLKQEKKIARLQIIILYVVMASLVLLVFLAYRFFRIKYKTKKKILNERRASERKKSIEVLEIKNKELTASALQVIQKEEMLSELKEELLALKKNPDINKINRLAKNIKVSSDGNWQEFEARFISVNKRFYSELNRRFPKLSQGDQKICALIKLNFSSKDMAKLLGISVESVHTTRYRLRKKLNLERSDNLEEFIASIG